MINARRSVHLHDPALLLPRQRNRGGRADLRVLECGSSMVSAFARAVFDFAAALDH
jgi:hypothetical protein